MTNSHIEPTDPARARNFVSTHLSGTHLGRLSSASRAGLKDIVYVTEEYDGKGQEVLRMHLHRVPRWLVVQAWSMFWKSVPSLKLRNKHSSQALAGDAGWSKRRKRDRINIGRCYVHFARTGILPIKEWNAGATGPRRFLLDRDALGIPAD